jgi:signal transduction histidine kinase
MSSSRFQERTAELNQTTVQLRAEIAQRQQIEEELLRARKLESLGVLAGGIAHDFNNFLAVVQGNVELAKSQLDRDAPVQLMLDETARACKRAALLSSQLLTFSKGGAPIRRLVSLAGLMMDAIPLARAGAQTSFDVCIPDKSPLCGGRPRANRSGPPQHSSQCPAGHARGRNDQAPSRKRRPGNRDRD